MNELIIFTINQLRTLERYLNSYNLIGDNFYGDKKKPKVELLAFDIDDIKIS